MRRPKKIARRETSGESRESQDTTSGMPQDTIRATSVRLIEDALKLEEKGDVNYGQLAKNIEQAIYDDIKGKLNINLLKN